MRTTRLDLGLALAAASRGYKVKRKSDPDFTMKLHYGAMKIFDESHERKTPGVLFKYSDLTYFGSADYYIVGDDMTWLETEPEV